MRKKKATKINHYNHHHATALQHQREKKKGKENIKVIEKAERKRDSEGDKTERGKTCPETDMNITREPAGRLSMPVYERVAADRGVNKQCRTSEDRVIKLRICSVVAHRFRKRERHKRSPE